jgi:uncharacterized protein YecT (DUF1311 family)
MLGFARLALVAILLIAPSLAQGEGAARQNCGELATGADQKQCAEMQYRKAADALREAYAGILRRAAQADAGSTPVSGEKTWSVAVTESQQAWEVYRDAECRGVVGRGGGSGRMVWVWGCLAEKTNARIRELNVPFDQR